MARANEQWGDHSDSRGHGRVTGLVNIMGVLLLQGQEPCPKAAPTHPREARGGLSTHGTQKSQLVSQRVTQGYPVGK